MNKNLYIVYAISLLIIALLVASIVFLWKNTAWNILTIISCALIVLIVSAGFFKNLIPGYDISVGLFLNLVVIVLLVFSLIGSIVVKNIAAIVLISVALLLKLYLTFYAYRIFRLAGTPFSSAVWPMSFGIQKKRTGINPPQNSAKTPKSSQGETKEAVIEMNKIVSKEESSKANKYGGVRLTGMAKD